MTTLIIIYWVAGALGLLYSIILLLAILRILKTLEGIARTIPKFQENQAKKYIQDTLKQGYIENTRQFTEASQILSTVKDDNEVRELIRKITALKKETEN